MHDRDSPINRTVRETIQQIGSHATQIRDMEVQQCRHMFFVSHTHFCNHILVSAIAWKPHPCFVCVCMYKSVGLQLCKARALDLCKATPIFSKHVLVPVNSCCSAMQHTNHR